MWPPKETLTRRPIDVDGNADGVEFLESASWSQISMPNLGKPQSIPAIAFWADKAFAPLPFQLLT